MLVFRLIHNTSIWIKNNKVMKIMPRYKQRPEYRVDTARFVLNTVIVFFTVVALSACSTIGPKRLISSHESYNDAVQLTVTREVLKNIVRKRYADPMQFIAVSSINAQFSVSSGANVGVSGLGTESASGQAGGNVGFSDSPTISFVPLSDAGFNKSIDTPINFQEALAFVFHTGRFQAYELGLMFGAINDATDRAGDRGLRYRDEIEALKRIVEKGGTLRSFREFYPRHEPIPMAQVNARAYVEAAKAGFYFYDAGDGKLNLASKHMGIGLYVPEDATIAEDLKMLGLESGEKMYPLRAPNEAEPEPFGVQPNTIWLAPRSVESMLELASLRVEVPTEHLTRGLVSQGGNGINSSVELPLVVHSAKDQPASMYRIQHRGYWFYIEDTDIVSKQIFVTIVDAYSSRIGSKSSSDAAPQIVLPI
jgi:hypothetical protein